jgi:NADPH2:quinone reductase
MCQWAKHLGATVIGTVSSDEKAAIAHAHGCDHPIVYTREDFAERVREITGGEGVPVVYDSVGKATFEDSLKCLRRRGLMASFGEASGDPDPMPPRRLARSARSTSRIRASRTTPPPAPNC